MDILGAAEKAAASDVRGTLKLAAGEGSTSTVETLLGSYAGKHQVSTEDVRTAAKEALTVAHDAEQWGTVVYLASFLEDSRHPHGGSCGGLSCRVVNCLLGDPSGGILGFCVPKTGGVPEKNESPLISGTTKRLTMGPIVFKHVDPEATPGDYGSVDEPSPWVYLTEEGGVSIEMLQDPDQIVISEGSIVVRFDYPLKEAHDLKLEPLDGASVFTRAGLARAIAKQYQQIYREEEETTQLPVESITERSHGKCGLVNRAETDGKWGIYGHDLSDLVLNSVSFDATEMVYSLSIDP